jgi:pimeloyl-ACP methyl ester carboxylesterase
MGVFKTSWQRQTLFFGHLHSDRYSVLILDNRGIGRSDKPLMRYSTSAMAADVLEVLDHLSWTGERQLHICGISSMFDSSLFSLHVVVESVPSDDGEPYAGR